MPLRLLLVSATTAEVDSLATGIRACTEHDLQILVTGVGMVATAAHVARVLATSRCDVALNVGLCGAFDRGLPIGSVVHVVEDHLAELGAEDGDRFLDVSELGLRGTEVPESSGPLANRVPPASAMLDRLPRVRGITVNTVHGREASIAEIERRLRPQVESMEGAAFMYACLLAGVPFAQVRAVSNRVERRNRETWRIPEALSNLAAAVTQVAETL